MDNTYIQDELQHHGIKGQRWGIRRYQRKDGSLTPAGQKRYDKEMEKLKAEKKKLTNEARVKKKMDKLEKMKSDVDDLKKKKKNGVDDKPEETPEEKRARLLKSTDPKELYENKDLLTYNELNERINRIDAEARLKSKITVEQTKTGMDYVNDKMKKTSDTLNNATNLYRKVDDAFSTVAKSAIGKTLAKQLGIELEPKRKEFDLDDFWKNRNKKTTQELMDVNKRLMAEEGIRKKRDEMKKAEKEKKEQEKRMEEARKQVDDYYKKLREEQERSSVYSKKADDIIDSTWGNKPISGFLEDKNSRNQYLIGQNHVIGLLEDKHGR